jgi:hypothetical protein
MHRLHIALGIAPLLLLPTPILACGAACGDAFSMPGAERAILKARPLLLRVQSKTDDKACVADRESLAALIKAGDPEMVKMSMSFFTCEAVQDEAKKWIEKSAAPAPPPLTPPTTATSPPPPPVGPKITTPTPPPPPPPPVTTPGTKVTTPVPPPPPPPPSFKPTPPPPPVITKPVQPPAPVAGDTIATARDLGRLRIGDNPFPDRFNSSDRAKYYKVTITDTAIITAKVARTSSDIELAIFDSSGRELDKTTRSNKDKVWIADVGKPAGTYYVAVLNSGRSSTAFDLTINLIMPAPANSHVDLSEKLTLGSGTTEFRASFGDETKFRYAEFEVRRAGLYKISLDLSRADSGADIDIRLYKASPGWKEIVRSEKGPGEPELLVEALEAGRYLIQLYRDAGRDADVVVSIAPTSDMINPEIEGAVVATHQDWTTVVRRRDGKKQCVIYTYAKTVSPAGWRGPRPVLQLRIDEDEDGVFHSFDKVRFYGSNLTWDANVRGTSANFKVPVMVKDDESDLKSLEKCNQDPKELCVADDGLIALTLGRELTLTGRTADGRTSTVVYSLLGYQKSVDEMNRECDNERRTGWLKKRKRS